MFPHLLWNWSLSNLGCIKAPHFRHVLISILLVNNAYLKGHYRCFSFLLEIPFFSFLLVNFFFPFKTWVWIRWSSTKSSQDFSLYTFIALILYNNYLLFMSICLEYRILSFIPSAFLLLLVAPDSFSSLNIIPVGFW